MRGSESDVMRCGEEHALGFRTQSRYVSVGWAQDPLLIVKNGKCVKIRAPRLAGGFKY